MNDRQTFLTFIVPAYNIADYIRETLDSILNQTCDDYKVLIINDGSTDGITPKICKEYMDKHPNKVSVINQENKGLGGARNTGLKYVNNSKYAMFLDSDDFLDYDFLRKLKAKLNYYRNRNIDLIFTLPKIFDDKRKLTKDWYDKEIFKRIFKNDSYCLPTFNPDLYKLEVNACRKIYSTNFLSELNFSFKEHVKYEDIFPHYYLLAKARNCLGFTITSFYYRINRPNQITMQKDETRLDVIKVFAQTRNFLENELKDQKIYLIFLTTAVKYAQWCINSSVNRVRKELVKQFNKFFREFPKPIIKQYYRQEKSRKNKLFLKSIRNKSRLKFIESYIYFELLKNKIFRR